MTPPAARGDGAGAPRSGRTRPVQSRSDIDRKVTRSDDASPAPDGAGPDDDAVLVGRCLDGRGDGRGDDDAWAELVARHGPLAWAAIRRAGLSGDDAADVYQTAWLAALESLPRLRHRERFGGWIARTAQLQAIRLRRTYGITRRVLGRIEPAEFDEAEPHEDLSRLEQRARMTRALARVGERCETLLRVLYFEDPSPAYTDIAKRMGMPIGSIGPTRARCLEKLERILGAEGGAP